MVLHLIFIVPDIFADRDPEPEAPPLQAAGLFPRFEISQIVEYIVGGQENLVCFASHPAVGAEKCGIEHGTSGPGPVRRERSEENRRTLPGSAGNLFVCP